ncbi:MAG: TIM-barrel domain-containing protein [Sandaracinaceae bacterium]
MKRTRLAWLLVLLAGCADDGSTDAGSDSGFDARVPTPQSIEISDARGRLVVDTDPLRIRLERADGSLALASAEGALRIGVAPSGDARYHDPTQPDPGGVTWSPVELGLSTSAPMLTAMDAGGRTVTIALSAPVEGTYRMAIAVDAAAEDVAMMRLALLTDDAGTYQGLGERFYDSDGRGWIAPMQIAAGGRASGSNETHVPIPFFASSNGYGVFVESRESGAFDIGATDASELWTTFEGRELDVYLYLDDDPREVVAAYTRQTGLPILPPRWAYAPMHWRNAWNDRAELEEDARRIRELHVPCTTFWIDNPWQVSYNDFVFDETRFTDPQGMLDGMRDDGFVPLLWSTPYLDAVDDGAAPTNEAETLFVMARDNGWLVRGGRREEIYLSPASPGSTGAMIDFTDEAATAFWQGRARTVVDMGVRAFKLDYAEDILPELLGERPHFLFSDGRTERELHNVYNTLYHVPYRRALDEGAGDDGGFLLVRASAYGGQSIADIVWPGDLDNDLREAGTTEVGGLPAAISGLITLAASGFPSFGSDTGGYRGGMPDRESLLRWAEHTAFTPILQLGGAGAHHNPWLYDAEAGDIYVALSRAHMDLVPFFRIHALRASAEGYPPLAHPSMIWPDDTAGHDDPYIYVLGGDILVAPVITPGATTRTLHLPPGHWVHWFTGEPLDGPADVTVDAPIGTPPVFVRRGALIPLGPEDLDTLVEAPAPLVTPSQRPYLRAWSFPEGRASVSTEEGPTLVVERTSSGLEVRMTPGASGVTDVRYRIELGEAEPALSGIGTVTVASADVPVAADAATVQAGCDGVCWFVEGDVLWLSARSATEVVAIASP